MRCGTATLTIDASIAPISVPNVIETVTSHLLTGGRRAAVCCCAHQGARHRREIDGLPVAYCRLYRGQRGVGLRGDEVFVRLAVGILGAIDFDGEP